MNQSWRWEMKKENTSLTQELCPKLMAVGWREMNRAITHIYRFCSLHTIYHTRQTNGAAWEHQFGYRSTISRKCIVMLVSTRPRRSWRRRRRVLLRNLVPQCHPHRLHHRPSQAGASLKTAWMLSSELSHDRLLGTLFLILFFSVLFLHQRPSALSMEGMFRVVQACNPSGFTLKRPLWCQWR